MSEEIHMPCWFVEQRETHPDQIVHGRYGPFFDRQKASAWAEEQEAHKSNYNREHKLCSFTVHGLEEPY